MNNMLINNLSIKRKLTLIILFISITALLLACFTFILFDRLRFKKIMVHDLGILAEIIGNNCTAALVFNTRGDAQETISSLKAHEHIISACIYDTANQEFARYIKRDSDRDDVNHIFQLALEKLDFAPSPDLSTQFIPRNNKQEKLSCFLSDYLVLFHPILLDNERIGILYLQSDIQELTSRFRQFLGILSITLIGIFVIILMLTARFQSLISEPILHLTQTARNVSSQKDYSIRAVKKFNDEIGFLIDNFNDMLARIENRDKALKNTSEELQQKAVQLKEELRERRRAEKKIKSSLHEKEILLQEIHHRVKNNLQIVSSLLNLQISDIKDEATMALFKDCHNRVKTMALIHEQLYQSKNLTKIDFSKYVESLATHLFHIYYKTSIHIDIEINVKDVSFNINTAIPCALLINELVSNSLKYAFPKKRRGKIGIILESQNTTPHLKTDLIPYKLVVSDNGIGLPENLDFRAVESLGFKLVNALVKQLNGSIRLTRTKKTVFTITFIASSISK